MNKYKQEGKKLYYYIGTKVLECDGYVWADSPGDASNIVKNAMRSDRISQESFELVDCSVSSREVECDESTDLMETFLNDIH